jgi:transposase
MPRTPAGAVPIASGSWGVGTMPTSTSGDTSTRASTRRSYHTIVCDLEQATVEFVAEGRKIESLGAFYDQLTPAQRDELAGVAMDMWEPFADLQALELKVGRAWAIKEALRTLWTYRQGAAVRRFFDRWYGWAIRSRLDPVKHVARMIRRHLDGVLRFAQHPLTNGVAEGLNS